jgi:hypothetical protein
VSKLSHVTATVVPYQLTGGWLSRRRDWRRKPTAGDGARPGEPSEKEAKPSFDEAAFGDRAAGTVPIGEVEWRHRVRVAGKVRSVRVQPRAGTANLECVLADRTGMLLLVFQGRRRIPGIQPGARLLAEGMVGDWSHRQAILNPDYELIAGPDAEEVPT